MPTAAEVVHGCGRGKKEPSDLVDGGRHVHGVAEGAVGVVHDLDPESEAATGEVPHNGGPFQLCLVEAGKQAGTSRSASSGAMTGSYFEVRGLDAEHERAHT